MVMATKSVLKSSDNLQYKVTKLLESNFGSDLSNLYLSSREMEKSGRPGAQVLTKDTIEAIVGTLSVFPYDME